MQTTEMKRETGAVHVCDQPDVEVSTQENVKRQKKLSLNTKVPMLVDIVPGNASVVDVAMVLKKSEPEVRQEVWAMFGPILRQLERLSVQIEYGVEDLDTEGVEAGDRVDKAKRVLNKVNDQLEKMTNF